MLEVSWRELTQFIESASNADLDQLIRAHHRYLNDVTSKSLLATDGADENLSRKLIKIFDTILGFQEAHVGFSFKDAYCV